MTETHENYEVEVGANLVIAKVEQRLWAGGAWVNGTLNGHRFEALVFPEKVNRPEWEYKGSRLTKLRLQREDDGKVVFHWDRRPITPAADATAEAIVDFLAAGLADHLYAR